MFLLVNKTWQVKFLTHDCKSTTHFGEIGEFEALNEPCLTVTPQYSINIISSIEYPSYYYPMQV